MATPERRKQFARAMRQLIDQGKKDPRIHELAARILRAANVSRGNMFRPAFGKGLLATWYHTKNRPLAATWALLARPS
jgi:hypothetical protein